MMPTVKDASGAVWPIVVPADRGRAMQRAILWILAGSISFVASWMAAAGRPQPSIGGGSILSYSVLIATMPIFAFAAVAMLAGLRWLLLACWPGFLGVVAERNQLRIRLGPMGSGAFLTSEIQIRYLYEMNDDGEDFSFEALLPPEVQRAKHLPMMVHASNKTPLNRWILRGVSADEESLAGKLGPAIAFWRGEVS